MRGVTAVVLVSVFLPSLPQAGQAQKICSGPRIESTGLPLPPAANVQERLLSPGARIRATTLDPMDPEGREQTHVGTFLRMDGESCRIETGDPAEVLAIPLPHLRVLEISAGTKSAGGRGAVIGLLAGAGAGVLFGLIGTVAGSSNADVDLSVIAPLLLGTVGGGVGAAIGFLIGSGTQVDRWETVPLDRLRLSAAPPAGG